MIPEELVSTLFIFCGVHYVIRGVIESDKVRSQMHRIEGLLCFAIAILLKGLIV